MSFSLCAQMKGDNPCFFFGLKPEKLFVKRKKFRSLCHGAV